MSFQNCQVHSGVVNPADYHSKKAVRGMKDYAMSPSALKEFGRCPQRWMRGYNSPDSDAKDYGSLLDCLVLTPELFEARYVVEPPTYVNEKGETKKWSNNATVCKEWHAQQAGKEVIKAQERADVETAKERLLADEAIASFIADSDKQVMVTGEWNDKATGLVVPVCCLMDLVPRNGTEFANCLGDLKSSFTAAVQPFNRNIHKLGYHIQAAFDTDLFAAATGEDRNTWCFILQESFPPWQPGKRILSQDFVELGRLAYSKLMAMYCQCLKIGFWPGYDDTDEAAQGWSICAPEPWMSSEMMFSPRFESDDAPESVEANCDTTP